MADTRKAYRVPLGGDRGTVDLLLTEADLPRYPGAEPITQKAARAPRNKARTPENK